MQTVKYVWWEEDGAWLGYLQDAMNAGDERERANRHEMVRQPLLTASIEGGKTVDRVEVKQITLSAHQETGFICIRARPSGT
jgi:hypothetical protein